MWGHTIHRTCQINRTTCRRRFDRIVLIDCVWNLCVQCCGLSYRGYCWRWVGEREREWQQNIEWNFVFYLSMVLGIGWTGSNQILINGLDARRILTENYRDPTFCCDWSDRNRPLTWTECISCRYIFSNNVGTLARPIYLCHLLRIYSLPDSSAIVPSKWSNNSNRRANNLGHRIFQQMVPANSHISRWHPSLDNPIYIRFACRSCDWRAETKQFHCEVRYDFRIGDTHGPKAVSSGKKQSRKCGLYGRMACEPFTTNASTDMKSSSSGCSIRIGTLPLASSKYTVDSSRYTFVPINSCTVWE